MKSGLFWCRDDDELVSGGVRGELWIFKLDLVIWFVFAPDVFYIDVWHDSKNVTLFEFCRGNDWHD